MPLASAHDPADMQGADVLACGVRALVVEQVKEHEASVWLRVTVDAGVGLPIWRPTVALEAGGDNDSGAAVDAGGSSRGDSDAGADGDEECD